MSFLFNSLISALSILSIIASFFAFISIPSSINSSAKENLKNIRQIKRQYIINGNCTLCGRCIDVCPQDALKYDFRLKKII
ncbi:MAG TPA: hypothetical protein DCO77_11845 [Nitrospiraceae bacterium]|nr:hypothetical protein [Nitrospiraceae bacterium]